MFKRVTSNSLRVLISVLFLVTFSSFYISAQTDTSGNQWYICQLKSKNKANEKKYFGPFGSKEETIANWIYRDLAENKKYCIALNLSYITASPSSYFGREYKAVKEDFDFDRDYFIQKYQIVLDDSIENAYSKAQAKNKKTEKTSNTEKKVESTETTKTKKSKNKKEAETTQNSDITDLSDSEKAKQNALLLKEQTKIAAQQASESAKLETEKAKENKNTTVENQKAEAIQNAQDLQSEEKETLKNAKKSYTELKEKAKADSEEAKKLAEENSNTDLFTLPDTLDQFYKKEKRDALEKQIKENATENKVSSVVEETEALSEDNLDETVPDQTSESPEIEEPQNFEEPVQETQNTEEIAEVSENTEEPSVDELPQEENTSETENFPFTFTSTATNVSRYKKEYLQDFMPEDKYTPQAENSLKQIIDNPDEVDAKGQTLLMKAAKSGNDWQIKTLLDSGANVNLKDNDGWTALMYACRYQESISTLKTLIEAGAKIKEKNNYDSSALILAASYNDNPEILNYLLKYYTNSEKEVLKCFILLLSSKQSSEYLQIAKVNLFMQKSIPLNTFYQGKTPLMYAAQYGSSTKTLKLLIDNDALTTIRSSEGKTAFDYAAKNSNLVHDENYWALNKK